MTTSGTVRVRAPALVVATASIAYVVLWFVTTQRPDVRAVVPFGEDPFDLFASIAILLLPLVGGLTVIRIVRYGPSRVPAGAVAARIELGLGICLGLVSAALAADIVALWQSPMERPDIPVATMFALALAVVGWVALVRSVMASPVGSPVVSIDLDLSATEPDALDDVVALLPITGGLRDRIGRSAEPIRRHRIVAGIGAAVAAGVAAVGWHGLREGAWASPGAALAYGGILVAILLVAYGLLVGPLRVLRAG